MSKAKFAAAKELINEKRYEEARTILRTIDHPTAQEWLNRLNTIAPPTQSSHATPIIPAPPTSMRPTQPQRELASIRGGYIDPEQAKFYRRENRRARLQDVGNGIRLILMGIVCFGIFAFTAMPTIDLETGQKVVNIGLGWAFIPLGLVGIIGGLYRIFK